MNSHCGSEVVDLCTYFPFVRTYGQFTEAEAMGSFVVHHDLATWAATSTFVRRVWILSDRLNIFSINTPLPTIVDSLRSLPLSIRGKIEVESCLSLQNRLNHYIAIGKSSEFNELARLRQRLQGNGSVCAIVHACYFPGVIDSYVALLLNAQRGDTLCVTSAASSQATRSFLAQAADHIERQSGAQSSRMLERINVVHTPLAVDDCWLDQSIGRDAARKLMGIPGEAYCVLYFGRLSREYKADIAPLLVAFKKVLRKCPSAVLVIAGSTIHQGQNRYERGCIDEYDLGEHVNLHTNTSPMIKKCLFAAADVFVAPSDNIVESFGLSILEAMGAKLPVVASDWSGYRELVRDGESGFLIETTVAVDGWRNASVLAECATTPHPEYYLAQRTIVNVGQLADRLCLLGEDRELRQKLGRKGYATVRESYVWSVAIRRFAEVWLQSLATRRSSGTPTMSASAPDLRRVFNSFASGEWTWDGERRVVTSHLCDDICLSHVVMDETTRSILVSCRDHPRTISEVAAGGDYSRRRVLWLMKRGLLEVEQD